MAKGNYDTAGLYMGAAGLAGQGVVSSYNDLRNQGTPEEQAKKLNDQAEARKKKADDETAAKKQKDPETGSIPLAVKDKDTKLPGITDETKPGSPAPSSPGEGPSTSKLDKGKGKEIVEDEEPKVPGAFPKDKPEEPKQEPKKYADASTQTGVDQGVQTDEQKKKEPASPTDDKSKKPELKLDTTAEGLKEKTPSPPSTPVDQGKEKEKEKGKENTPSPPSTPVDQGKEKEKEKEKTPSPVTPVDKPATPQELEKPKTPEVKTPETKTPAPPAEQPKTPDIKAPETKAPTPKEEKAPTPQAPKPESPKVETPKTPTTPGGTKKKTGKVGKI